MSKKIKWTILLVLIVLICSFTLMKSNSDIVLMLEKIANEMRMFAVILHIISFILLLLGVLIKKLRTQFLVSFLLLVSLSAFLVGVKYFVLPNILIFGTFFILTVSVFRKKGLEFHFKTAKLLDKIIGILSLIFAFYYLHWVDAPVYLNSLIYSPLGILNCPTMLAFTGLLCFVNKKETKYLEVFVGSITLYFGFLGMLCLGAHIDVVLIISGAFILMRYATKLKY